jgi:hypothetical protein
MSIKKTKKKSSKRIGDPRQKPKAKPPVRKKAPTKAKSAVPKEGDYFLIYRDYGSGDIPYPIRGIVRKQNKSLMLCNNEVGDYEEDESSLPDNLGFQYAFQLEAEDLKEMAETGTVESCNGIKLIKYTVITDPRLKAAIDRTRGSSILNYSVTRHDDNSLSFGCGDVVLDREQLQAILRIKKANKMEDVRLFAEVVDELRSNVDSYDLAEVTVEQVEGLLKMIPASKPSKKTPKKRKR